jgi:hypothetical protein
MRTCTKDELLYNPVLVDSCPCFRRGDNLAQE